MRKSRDLSSKNKKGDYPIRLANILHVRLASGFALMRKFLKIVVSFILCTNGIRLTVSSDREPYYLITSSGIKLCKSNGAWLWYLLAKQTLLYSIFYNCVVRLVL